MADHPILIVTGASGSGKTTLVNHIKESLPDVQFLHFDSIGIPNTADMIKEYGSGEGWQKAKTYEWIQRLKADYQAKGPVIFEGQMRISFIKEAIHFEDISGVTIVLIDCADNARMKRLVDSGRPELANQTMMNWAKFLRKEAQEFSLVTLDTSGASVEETAEILKGFLSE